MNLSYPKRNSIIDQHTMTNQTSLSAQVKKGRAETLTCQQEKNVQWEWKMEITN